MLCLSMLELVCIKKAFFTSRILVSKFSKLFMPSLRSCSSKFAFKILYRFHTSLYIFNKYKRYSNFISAWIIEELAYNMCVIRRLWTPFVPNPLEKNFFSHCERINKSNCWKYHARKLIANYYVVLPCILKNCCYGKSMIPPMWG